MCVCGLHAEEYVLEIIKCHRAGAFKYAGRCFTTLCLVLPHYSLPITHSSKRSFLPVLACVCHPPPAFFLLPHFLLYSFPPCWWHLKRLCLFFSYPFLSPPLLLSRFDLVLRSWDWWYITVAFFVFCFFFVFSLQLASFYFFRKTNLMCEVFMAIQLRAHCSCYSS